MGPLIEKIKIAANYNSANSLGISGPAAAVQGKLPQVCFAPQTCSIQIQTDLITNVTIERFTNILNGDNASEFAKFIDITLSGHGLLEMDSKIMFGKFIMEKKLSF